MYIYSLRSRIVSGEQNEVNVISNSHKIIAIILPFLLHHGCSYEGIWNDHPQLTPYIIGFGAGGRPRHRSFVATLASMQIIFSPFWGRVSDLSQACLDDCAIGHASTELWMLIPIRILAGNLSSATYPTAMIDMGDCTSERSCAGVNGIIGYKKSMDV